MAGILSKHRFEAFLQNADRDLLAELLADKRSPNTRKAYERDLRDFFLMTCGEEPSRELVNEFLGLERFTAIALVLKYKSALVKKGLSEATVNRRLAAIRSLVKFAQKCGKCVWSLEEVQGEKVQSYRDTSGVDVATYQAILETCDRATLIGVRNYALLHLLWSNALRREEVSKLNIADLETNPQRLRILGKGRGSQAEWVSLSQGTTEAILSWLKARGSAKQLAPLFIALDSVHHGHRLSGTSIYRMVQASAQQAGIEKQFSPHRIRHSSITAALELSGGDVRSVQQLSRHRSVQVVMTYNDRRIGVQQKLTQQLSDSLSD